MSKSKARLAPEGPDGFQGCSAGLSAGSSRPSVQQRGASSSSGQAPAASQQPSRHLRNHPGPLHLEEGASAPALLICPSALPPPSALGAPRRDARQRSLVPSQNQGDGQRPGTRMKTEPSTVVSPVGQSLFCPFHLACERPITLYGSSLQAGDTHKEHNCSRCKAMKDRRLTTRATLARLQPPDPTVSGQADPSAAFESFKLVCPHIL